MYKLLLLCIIIINEFINCISREKLRHENCSQTIITNNTQVEIKNFPDPLGFYSNADCLNTFEWVLIVGIG